MLLEIVTNIASDAQPMDVQAASLYVDSEEMVFLEERPCFKTQ